MSNALSPFPFLLISEPRAQRCQGCTELRAHRRQKGVRESSYSSSGAPWGLTVTCLSPGAHISQTGDRPGMCPSPQWRLLPLGNHYHAPVQPCWRHWQYRGELEALPLPCTLVSGLHQECFTAGGKRSVSIPVLCCLWLLQTTPEVPGLGTVPAGSLKVTSLLHSTHCTCPVVHCVPATTTTKPCVWTWAEERDLVLVSPLGLCHAPFIAFIALVTLCHFKFIFCLFFQRGCMAWD